MLSDPLAARIAARAAAAEARANRLREAVPALARELVERGATRVVLFGSLASGAAPHMETDIDLCVEGLTLADAERAELELTGPDTPIHVVRWEAASPELRSIIETYGIVLTGDTREPR